MRVIKQNTVGYVPFSNSLERLKKTRDGFYSYLSESDIKFAEESFNAEEGKLSLFNFYEYVKKINVAKNNEQLLMFFKQEAGRLTFFSELEIFLLNSQTSECKPINPYCNKKIKTFVTKRLKDGIIDWLIETQKSKIIPFETYNQEFNTGLNCLLIPIFSNGNFKGVLTALTSFTYLSEDSVEYRYLYSLLNLTYNRIQVEQQKDELNKTYSEVQVLQSKLINDFRLAALGELTYRSIEDIASPLQVIISYADLLNKDYPQIGDEETETIKKQVYDVKGILDRLIKFFTEDDGKLKLQSCSVNEAVNEFHQLIEPALKADNFECVLDLEQNIPPVLSNPNYLKQIFINAFSLINPLKEKGGGIIIQSRYSNENIILKMSFTNSYDSVDSNDQNLGVKILNNLMTRHEGSFIFNNNGSAGVNLVFTFPLRRKVRI